MTGFIIGIFVGGFIGVAFMALCVAGSKEPPAPKPAQGRMVYIASPYKGDIKRNLRKAAKYTAGAIKQGAIPISPSPLLQRRVGRHRPAGAANRDEDGNRPAHHLRRAVGLWNPQRGHGKRDRDSNKAKYTSHIPFRGWRKKGDTMNKCIFMGRLGNTPELRYTQNGVAVCTFTIAVDRPRQKDKEEEADWPTIVAWRNKAEFAAKYLSKGRKVLITATAKTRSYEDKDGNKRKVTEFYAEDIEFCDKKPQQDAAGAYTSPSQELPDGFEEIEGPDEDLPF